MQASPSTDKSDTDDGKDSTDTGSGPGGVSVTLGIGGGVVTTGNGVTVGNPAVTPWGSFAAAAAMAGGPLAAAKNGHHVLFGQNGQNNGIAVVGVNVCFFVQWALENVLSFAGILRS